MSAGRAHARGVLRGLVVDVQPLWRAALASVLRRLGVGTIATCGSTEEFDALLSALRPHLVVGDPAGLPEVAARLDDLAATAQAAAVAVITNPAAGAWNVSKWSELSEIEEALHSLIVERLDWATLTIREVEVLQLVSGGASNRDVARTLWLSEQTVKFHLANVYRKLGVSGRRDAVRRADEIGLLATLPLQGLASADGALSRSLEDLAPPGSTAAAPRVLGT